MTPEVKWIILVANNYTATRDFYRDTLGFKVEREIEAEKFCQFVLANCFLAIYSRGQMERLIHPKYLNTAGGAIYSFPDSTDIDADYAKLKAKGVVFISEPTTQPWGQRTCYFTDPDGHIWELQQWLNT